MIDTAGEIGEQGVAEYSPITKGPSLQYIRYENTDSSRWVGWGDRMSNDLNNPATLDKFEQRLRLLEQAVERLSASERLISAQVDTAERLRVLEEAVGRLSANERQIPAQVDGALRTLGRRTVNNRPQSTYLNERFRQYEWALINVKVLGYELAERLSREGLRLPPARPPVIRLNSKLSVQRDFESDWFAFWCSELRRQPAYHRKLWELCFISQSLHAEGMLANGMRGLAFGVGREPLPSLFVKYGASILATDLAAEESASLGWAQTSEHAASAENVRQPSVCRDPVALARIDFRTVDMNAIPEDLYGCFDFCWSACALEHLGNLAKGLEFIENSLRCLRPGGVAVHTTEFTVADCPEEIDNWSTVFYNAHQLTEFAGKLTAIGYQVAPLDLDHGDGLLDHYVDIAPWGTEARLMSQELRPVQPHVKLSVDGFACTSAGLIIRKP
jgi:SAM-dependent methyltransferase